MRKLFSLLAISAVAASCTQDELVPAGNNTSANLGDRPTIGNVSLGLGAWSRMGLQDGSSLKLAWDEGDKLGACIIDAPKAESVKGKAEGTNDLYWTYAEYVSGAKKTSEINDKSYTAQEAGLTASDFYETVNYVSTNYPYTKEGDIFTTQANLVEGNYMFYAPYNEKQLMREEVKAVLPIIQDCTDAVMRDTKYKGESATVSSTALDKFFSGKMEGFENAPVVVGYKFLAAPTDGSVIKPSVKLANLYAYPMITVVNDFNGYFYGENNTTTTTPKTATIKIDSIQIYHSASSDNNIFYKANLASSNIASILKVDGEWDNTRFSEGAPTSDLLGENITSTYFGTNASQVSEPLLEEASTALGYKQNHVTCIVNKELRSGEKYHFHAILPAGDYGKSSEVGLNARIYATIEGKRYVIVSATNKLSGSTPNQYYVSEGWKDFTFSDAINGNQNCELVRGEHYPKAEIREDGTATKSFAGSMLTLNLKNGTAFELKTEETPVEGNYGFKSNKDFIDYLIDNVQRGVALKEVEALNKVNRSTWKTYTSNSVTASAGHFAFATDSECEINAQFIKDLKQQTVTTGNEDAPLTLTATNLPISDDVKFTVSSKTYTFTTLDEEAVTYNIVYDGVIFNTNNAGLTNGINNISATDGAELKVKEGVNNAVVVLNGEANVTLKDCKGISAIYVATGTTLNVECECSSLIIANMGTINIKPNGSLTNTNNEFNTVSIINNSLRTVNGTITGDSNIFATFGASWPTDAVPASSRVNYVSINKTVAGNQNIEQAQIDIFANLEAITLILGDNITSITSNTIVR